MREPKLDKRRQRGWVRRNRSSICQVLFRRTVLLVFRALRWYFSAAK